MTPRDQVACPTCGHRRSRIYDVRREPATQEGIIAVRRRECLACQTRFRTRAVERVVSVVRVITTYRAST